MKRLLAKFFASPKASLNTKHRARLDVDGLEKRDLMAAYISGGNLVLVGTSGNDSMSVNNYSATWVKVITNGTTQYFLKSAITTGNVGNE